MQSVPKLLICLIAYFALSSATIAQSGNLAFSGMAIDPSAPVEVSADELSVSQTDGAAVFSGNVRVAQGDMKMTAGSMRIEYGTDEDGQQRRISRLLASGGVTLVTPSEAAEAEEAVYSIEDGSVILTGDVLLTQGPNAISGDRLTIDLASGSGNIEGRVRTILQAGEGN